MQKLRVFHVEPDRTLAITIFPVSSDVVCGSRAVVVKVWDKHRIQSGESYEGFESILSVCPYHFKRFTKRIGYDVELYLNCPF